MKIKLLVATLVIQIFCAQLTLSQQGRGVEVVQTNADGGKQVTQLYEGSYALIIGNSEYSSGWGRLSGVKSDVVAVRNILAEHGFKVEVEENLTSEVFEARIRRFVNAYGLDRDNRLIIYYAGHGYTLKSAGDARDLGYIIPTDTPLPSKDERGFRQKAVNMYSIQSFAKQIQAKHALFVFDSCFSGKLFALRDSLKIAPFILDKVNHPVRQFITAGDETQTVPDESIFRKAFVRALEGEADRNHDTYITGTELADYLKEVVTNYSNRRQTPQYGTLNDIELDRGDVVFTTILKSKVDKNKIRGAALVIGNSDYINASTSPFSQNDAKGMRNILQMLGFEVVDGGTNVTKKEMNLLIETFNQKLKLSGGVGLFFYSGHGVEFNNINYLIPTDYPFPPGYPGVYDFLKADESLKNDAIDIERVLIGMSNSTNKLKILVVDASLRNFYPTRDKSRNPSLAYLTRMPKDTFIAYASSFNGDTNSGVGENNAFTELLLNRITERNLELTDMFRLISDEIKKTDYAQRQSPWFISNMTEPFYFVRN